MGLMSNINGWVQNTLPFGNGEKSYNNKNEKFDIFNQIDKDFEHKTNNLAVTIDQNNYQNYNTKTSAHFGSQAGDNYYNKAYNLDGNKVQRLLSYRNLACQSKVSECLEEIITACVNSQKDEDIISFELRGDYDDHTKKELENEWTKFIKIFDLKNKGRDYFNDLLVEGEVFFENVISSSKPHLGILDVKRIPSENINVEYCNVQNDSYKGFNLKKKIECGNNNKNTTTSIKMHKYQVTYAHSGRWDQSKSFRIPYIENARKAQTQLNLLEDAVVINALVNAPDRLVFDVDVGSMSKPEEEQYMNKLIHDYYTKKGIDKRGNTMNKYSPLSITDNFFFTKKNGQTGTTVQRLAGSGAFANNFSNILQHFHNSVYIDMRVPVNRLNPEAIQGDGTTATFQEVAFGERVKEIQNLLAKAIRNAFITHLKLKGIEISKKPLETKIQKQSNVTNISEEMLVVEHYDSIESNFYGKLHHKCKVEHDAYNDSYQSAWQAFDLNEHDLDVTFSLPTITLALREQQLFELRLNNFNQVVSNENISFQKAAKEFLGWSENDFLSNKEMLRQEAACNWELSQIEAEGPDFRQKLEDQFSDDSGEGGEDFSDSELDDIADENDDVVPVGDEDAAAEVPEFGGS